jgi:hypothetical protein
VGPRTRSAPELHTDWRIRCLRGAGFDRRASERVGRDPRYDLHAVLELLDRGCRHDLAVRILAPLDEEPER